MYLASNLKRGFKIIFQKEPYEIINFEHHKPGKGAGIVRTKLKNLITNSIINLNLRSGEKIIKADLKKIKVKYLYKNNLTYFFIEMKTFEQFEVKEETIKKKAYFLSEDTMLDILLFNNKIISIDFPLYVILKVKKSLPSVKGNTLNNANKIIEFDTGYCCQVPLFIKIGNMIKINTNNGKYIERIN